MSVKVTIAAAETGSNEGDHIPGQQSVEMPMVAPNYQAMPEVPEGGGRDPLGNPQSAFQLKPDSVVTVGGMPMSVESAVTLGLMKPLAEGGFAETDEHTRAGLGDAEQSQASPEADLGGPSAAEVSEANRTIAAVVGQIGTLQADTLIQALAEGRASGADLNVRHAELVDLAQQFGVNSASAKETVNAIMRAERVVELEADRALRGVGISNPEDFREWAEGDPTRLKLLAHAGSAIALGGDTGPLLGLAQQFQAAAPPKGNARLDALTDSEMEAMAPPGHELVRQAGVVVIRGPSIPIAMPLSQAVAQGYVLWNGNVRSSK